MQFEIQNLKESILYALRQLGYIPRVSANEDLNAVKPLLRGPYPRFHLYIKENKENSGYVFNLHLDQKKPSYEGSSAHSGEYEGELVGKEAERIKKIIGG